jgi:hypothetical protein
VARIPETISSSNSMVPTSYMISTSEPGDKPIIADLDVIYVLAGFGGGILILTILVITMCTIYFCVWLPKRKRQLLTLEEDEQPHGR